MPLFPLETEVSGIWRLSRGRCSRITVWHGSCSTGGSRAMTAAQRIESSFPQPTEIYNQMHKDGHLHNEVLHLSQALFPSLRPSGRKQRSIWSRIARLTNIFRPAAVRLFGSGGVLKFSPTEGCWKNCAKDHLTVHPPKCMFL